jgi:hypothetical protein
MSATATVGIPVVHYRPKIVDAVNIFYREAGPVDSPVVLLLQGSPTSSHMFRNLIPALKDPDRIAGIIVQNGNTCEEGLREFWDPIKKYWEDGSIENRYTLSKLMSLKITKFQYNDGVADTSRISPETGCMTRRCSTAQETMKFSSTCSTIIGRTCRFIRRFRRISENTFLR